MNNDQACLASYMSDLSEEYWCAGWLDGLEYQLWAHLHSDNRAFGLGIIKEEEIQRLRELSEKCGGWIYWNNERSDDGPMMCETFIPLEEWKTKYEQYTAKLEAWVAAEKKEKEDEP